MFSRKVSHFNDFRKLKPNNCSSSSGKFAATFAAFVVCRKDLPPEIADLQKKKRFLLKKKFFRFSFFQSFFKIQSEARFCSPSDLLTSYPFSEKESVGSCFAFSREVPILLVLVLVPALAVVLKEVEGWITKHYLHECDSTKLNIPLLLTSPSMLDEKTIAKEVKGRH